MVNSFFIFDQLLIIIDDILNNSSRFDWGPIVPSLVLRIPKILNNKDQGKSSSANWRSTVLLKKQMPILIHYLKSIVQCI